MDAVVDDCYQKLLELETTPEALAATCGYVRQKMCVFLRKQEKVLVCFPDTGEASLGGIMGQAVRACGGVPVFAGPDYRWKELLRLTFDIHAHTIIAHPMVALGLMKLAKNTGTPLYIYNVVLCGFPYTHWMVEGIKKGLDCRVWGCYSVRCGPVIVGFSCECDAGIHVREDVFAVRSVDNNNSAVPEPGHGRLILMHKRHPEVAYDTCESSLLLHQPCACGCDTPRIVNTNYISRDDPTKTLMVDKFLSWYSVLDFRASLTPGGVALEVVVFPGSALPKFPGCARRIVKPWNPEEDTPFVMERILSKKPNKFAASD